MKFNKWTLGLAAIGAVSLSSAVTAKAAEDNMNPVQASLSGISISGAVDTSVDVALDSKGSHFNDSPIGYVPFHNNNNGGVYKQDGFNLNVVELNLEKPLDESEWASGFKAQVIMGPDAQFYNSIGYGGGSGFTIKQAYVDLRTPVGNGIEWKIGVFDTVIGYEVFESWKNPNYTRSWGWNLEPTQHEGILGSYQINDIVSISAGVANTFTSGIGARNTTGDTGEDFWCKTWMGAITLTAPESMGFLAGSALYAGAVYGFDGSEDDRVNLYVGAVVNTPVAGLTTGFAFDYVDSGDAANDKAYNLSAYASYKATEKLSLHGRAEYGWFDADVDPQICYWGLTGTVQYDLWANVISRLELRYEVAQDGYNAGYTSGGPLDRECGLGLYLNLTYVF